MVGAVAVTVCGGAELGSVAIGGGGKTDVAVGHSVTVTVTVTSVHCISGLPLLLLWRSSYHDQLVSSCLEGDRTWRGRL